MMESDTNCINVAECSSVPTDPNTDICQCGDVDDDEEHKEPILPGMSDANSQFNPYCEPAPKKTFKSVVKRHFVKDKLFNLVGDFLRSIEEEKQAQLDVIASFAQVRAITAPIRKANNTKVDQPTVLKRRKSRSNVPLLERIVQTRLDNEKNKENGANVDIVVTDTDSKIVGEIQINQPDTKVQDETIKEDTVKETPSNNINHDTIVVKTKPKEPVYLDEELEENNNDKQATNKHDNTLFRCRRSISSLPSFLEKCSVMKYLRNVNNIREIDQLVLESMEENTSTANTPRSWRYRRTSKKKKQSRTEKEESKDRGNDNKQCQVIVEVESNSGSDSDEESTAIVNGSHDKSNKNHRDSDNELQAKDKPDSDDEGEENRFAMPPTRKLTVNISSLDTIAEASHESFSTLHSRSTREPSPSVTSNGRQDSKRSESNGEDQHIHVNNCRHADDINDNDDKTERAQISSKKSGRKTSSLKVNGKHNSVHVLNSKRTRPGSKEQRGRTFTLDILDVYEENADLQTASSPVNRVRSKSAKPRLDGEKRTRVKFSKRQIAPMTYFDHLRAEHNGTNDEDNPHGLHRPITSVSPRVNSNSTNSLEDAETYFQVLKNSQKDKIYRKPDRVLWYDLDISEGGYNMCNGSSMKDSDRPYTCNSPIKEAIKNIKGAKEVPEIREMNETVPREQRVGRLYKNLRKERSKSARGEYRMLKTPSHEENGYYID